MSQVIRGNTGERDTQTQFSCVCPALRCGLSPHRNTQTWSKHTSLKTPVTRSNRQIHWLNTVSGNIYTNTITGHLFLR